MKDFWYPALAATIGQKDLEDKADTLLSVCSKLQDELNILREEYVNLLDAAGRSGYHPWAVNRLRVRKILNEVLSVPSMYSTACNEGKKEETK